MLTCCVVFKNGDTTESAERKQHRIRNTEIILSPSPMTMTTPVNHLVKLSNRQIQRHSLLSGGRTASSQFTESNLVRHFVRSDCGCLMLARRRRTKTPNDLEDRQELEFISNQDRDVLLASTHSEQTARHPEDVGLSSWQSLQGAQSSLSLARPRPAKRMFT